MNKLGRIATYLFITSLFLMIGCGDTIPKPSPKPKSKTAPTEQYHIFKLSFVDFSGKSISGVEFKADVELLGSIENEKLLESKSINKTTNNSGIMRFEITHPIIQLNSKFSTYTLVNYTVFKDGFIDKSGSFNIQHSEPMLTKDYKTDKMLTKEIILLQPRDFVNKSFDLYSNDVKVEYDDIENCISTFALFPSTYGQLKTGSVRIVKSKGKFYLEFGFNSSVDNDWLLNTYRSIGRRMGSSLFDSGIYGVRLRINQTTTYTTSKDSLNKYLDHKYTDSKFLKKIKKG